LLLELIKAVVVVVVRNAAGDNVSKGILDVAIVVVVLVSLKAADESVAIVDCN
jgi:hypothetical protein